MPVEPWVRNLVESTLGGPPVEIGRYYVHPDDGPIQIVSGRYWGEHGISNFWDWRILATGEVKHGYADNWPVYNVKSIPLTTKKRST